MASDADPEPFAEMLAGEFSGLYDFIARNAGPVVRARESCVDLAQSVAREALEDESRFEYRGREAFRGWLRQRAIHKILRRREYHLAQKRDLAREASPSPSVSSSLADLARDDQTPSVELSERQAVERIERAIAELPEHFRLAITMHKLLGFSHREIAEQTGQTEGAVRNHLYRGLARLGQRLAE